MSGGNTMKKDMDKIQFESRYEIRNVLAAIGKYVTQNPKEKHNKTLSELYNLLDVMDMEW